MAALCRRWQRATAVLPHFRPQPVCHIATGDIAGRLHLYEELQAASILDARKARAMARSVGAVQPEQRSALVQRARQREKDRKRAAKAKAAKALEQAKRAAANPGMAAFLDFERSQMKKKQRQQAAGTVPLPSAKARKPAPAQRPEEPDPASCCGNDCQRCVWIVYWEELQAWEDRMAKAATA